jgi:hypothetical protein
MVSIWSGLKIGTDRTELITLSLLSRGSAKSLAHRRRLPADDAATIPVDAGFVGGISDSEKQKGPAGAGLLNKKELNRSCQTRLIVPAKERGEHDEAHI